ncbi:PPP family 3-phenylpropionic acid transporter [Roseibium marinum]|uniref:PPP family 3-phenylpropionic acid transporter n=2 Tax=Roseibium marinum TaxID=281252 RepID=A0A2S3UKE9_9HYPH|nr:PPP family 3-phenylpropionic acid transporter [Roseibium marinum]
MLPYHGQLALKGKTKIVNIPLGAILDINHMTRTPPKVSTRVSGLFAVHFFGFGLFLPFLPVVLEFRGLSAEDIGFILGAGTITRIAASPLLANIADRTGQRRLAILIYSLAGAAFIGLFCGPAEIVLIGSAVVGYMVFQSPVLPLSDAYALDVARNTGTDYARMRLWGSAGFVGATLVGGTLAAQATNWLLLLLIAISALMTGLVAMSMPSQKRGDRTGEPDRADQAAPFASVWFWPVLAVFGLFQASHAAFYGFGTLYWQAMDVPDFTIGVLWAIGVVAEIGLFAIAARLPIRMDPPVFLLVAGIAAVVRWGLFPLADTFAAMAALQLLHGLTFGAAHLGSLAILAKVVPSRWSGTGQGLLATSIGIQMAIGLGVCGALYETDPDLPFYLMAAVAAVGVLLVLALTPLMRRRMAAAG